MDKKRITTIIVIVVASILMTVMNVTGVFLGEDGITSDLTWSSQSLVELAMQMHSEGDVESSYGLFYGEGYEYASQVGIQGKIFSSLLKGVLPVVERISLFEWGISGLLAMVISVLCYEIYKKYNWRFAATFYLVTLLSPWVIGFSTNLYWMEFTWFLPMLVGIYCANRIEKKQARLISYISVMFAIAFKCACGYEYISTIMMSSIVFLLADFTIALIERKDKEKIKRLFQTIFIMGLCALAGFILVFLYHAYLRGQDDILKGIRQIYNDDVLRRTLGGDADRFQEGYTDSLQAPVMNVVRMYLNFHTPLIYGVSGWYFMRFIKITSVLIVFGVLCKKMDKSLIPLFIWVGLASLSWFVLGKAHSYIHTFLNYVMWYFGFVQMIFFAHVETVFWAGKVAIDILNKMREKKNGTIR